MDFDKIKTSVEEINLSDFQKQTIINACNGKKRRFSYKPLVAAAAVFVISLAVLASPGFLLKAGAPMTNDTAENAVADDCVDYFCDSLDGQSENGTPGESVEQPSSAISLYTFIPDEFSLLVDSTEFELWYSSFSAENGMAIQQFVGHFGIAREDFDKANSECGNIFDADIIYSFDRELTDSVYK